MHITQSPAYRNAFVQYLRKGTPIELSLKAAQKEHPTTHYIWRTNGDSKVRPSHAANEGKIFAWDNPPLTGHPGEEYNCRCRAEPYYGYAEINDPPIDSVYPELLIISLLRVPKLVIMWREWLSTQHASRNWQLSPTKSAIKWRNRLEKGDWTPDKITETIRYGTRHRALNERTGGMATRYQYGNRYIVRDDTTGDILQVSRPGHEAKVFE